MSGVLFDFVEFARNVVVEVEQSAVEVLRAVDQCLILTGPRFDVHDRDARIERPKVLIILTQRQLSFNISHISMNICTYQVGNVGNLNGVLYDFNASTTVAFFKLILFDLRIDQTLCSTINNKWSRFYDKVTHHGFVEDESCFDVLGHLTDVSFVSFLTRTTITRSFGLILTFAVVVT